MLISKPRFPIRELLLYGFLPSWLKKILYRLMGYRIGRSVSLGFGSVLCAKDVTIGDHTRIGLFSLIRGTRVRLGRHVSIGAGTLIDVPILEVGEGTKFNEQVFVGGLQFPDSKLVVGRNCQIMQMTFINPTRSITIGDDTGIGGDCLLFGHTSWLSEFEGYPVDFQPIEIGSSVSLAWRVFILPGVTVGDGAVVGANSLVNRPVPPRCLAVGFPAKVVGKSPYFPRTVSEEDTRHIFRKIVEDMVQFFEGHGMPCRRSGSSIEWTAPRGGWLPKRRRVWRLRVCEDEVGSADSKPGADACHVWLSLKPIPQPLRRELTDRGIMWIDIGAKERSDHGNELGEEIALFLRRYGVRFFRAGP